MSNSRLYLVPEKGVLCPYTEPVFKLDPSYNGLLGYIEDGDTFLMAMNHPEGLHAFESIPQESFRGVIAQECQLVKKVM